MIQLKNIKKIYKVKKGVTFEAIKSVSLNVEKGDIYGIIGFSGAGKSTLLRTINLLEKPDEGEVLIEGKNIMTLKKKELRHTRQSISMIFQHFNLIHNKTVYDNVSFPLEIAGIPGVKRKSIIEECLSIVQLEDKADQYPSSLSGGQKQRVAIARALATNPKILLCDEPTSALDPQTTESILAFLKKINQELNITMVIVTHEMDVVRKICNKVAVMEKGSILEEFTLSDQQYDPKSEIAKLILNKGKRMKLNA
ncbi:MULTISPECIES: methionine ABC transporter ATP-binding protein [unclassified Paenibacillus]|uniref:methionine ABC transporter ATP-binding protein n=1 Tax=unclassified Paenibacillus TaxID=185978 RepID=UPI0021177972|nr:MULTISPECIES: methionine ABC transporter ATP-binding protein [unclassified Paenibacillus]